MSSCACLVQHEIGAVNAWTFVEALRVDSRLWWGGFILTATLAAYTAYFTFPVLAAMALAVLLVSSGEPHSVLPTSQGP